jgi:hypothetical protein
LARTLAQPTAPYGSVFAADPRYIPSALTTQPHLFSPGQEIWLHRSRYSDGPPNYWYAFAGNPNATPARSWDPVAPSLELRSNVEAVVADRAILSLTISEPIVGLGPEHLRLVDADGATVEGTVSVDAASGDISVRPRRPLELSARYTLQLLVGATDLAGNPLAARDWPMLTRLDADPLVRPLPARLAPGSHDLVRFDAAWNETERRDLELRDGLAVAATARARLPDRQGTWLALRGDGLDGWWVAESPAAHAIGTVADGTFAEPQPLVMAAGSHELFSLDGGMVAAAGVLRVGAQPQVAVDRRMVVDGTTYLRVQSGPTGVAGRWIVADPTDPSFAAARGEPEHRLMASEPLSALAELRLRSGDWTLFRLDPTGRVLERRTVAGADVAGMSSDREVLVGTARMFVIAAGDHAGWAVRADTRLEVIPGRPELGSPD